MIKIKFGLLVLTLAIGVPVLAQQNTTLQASQVWDNANDLLNKGQYVAAAEQFGQIENWNLKTSNQPKFESELPLMRENAQYYSALCALELKNENAESLFLKFINEHPENPLARLALFQLGKGYSKRENFVEALKWFNKLDAEDLSGNLKTEYQFRKGYAYFASSDFKNASDLFSLVKEKKSEFSEDATYYYAYIAYLNKDYKLALSNFERLKSSKKYENSYPYYISAVYFLDKRYNDVIAYAVPILKSTHQQNETELLRVVAASYFANGDYDNSANYYTQFQAKDEGKTQNTQDTYQIGYTFFKVGNYKKAVDELEKLQNKSDTYSQSGNYTLGDVFLRMNNKQSARNAFFAASRLDFDKTLKEDALYQYAKLSYELDFNSMALDATRLFLKSYPSSSKIQDAKVLLGEELLTSHNYKEAVDMLEPIPNKSASALAAYQKVTYYRGLEFYNERAFENAIGIFLRSLKNPIDPKIQALATYWMAESMYEVRKYGEAVERFEKFLSMPIAKTTTIYNFSNYALGYAAFNDEQYKKAALYFQRFLNGDLKDPNTENDAIIRLGDSYFVLKEYGKAMDNYNHIIDNQLKGVDYALFQRGMIQGLRGVPMQKISTLNEVLNRFPQSDYADDASFEIAYTWFLNEDTVKAKKGLQDLITKYPTSSYVPRAWLTIGLIDYDAGNEAIAIESFKHVVAEYASTNEAKISLKQIEKIYTDLGDAKTFMTYASNVPIANYTTADQERIMYNAANNLYLRGNWQGTTDAVNAYFDKFTNKPIYEKEARFIRAQSLVSLNRPDEAVADYNVILNDWTSTYTEQALISISKLYIAQKKYNEAIPYLKKLESNSEFKVDYSFAINNLMICYSQMDKPQETISYASRVSMYEKTAQEDKYKTGLYAGLAYLKLGDTTNAIKQFSFTESNTKTIAAAEAKYNIANIQYKKGQYKASQKTCFELIKDLPNYDYWITKTFMLLADDYVGLKDNFQAKATLQSIIDNYKVDDDILPVAKQKLEKLNAQK